MKKKLIILFFLSFLLCYSVDTYCQIYKISNKVLIAGYIYDTKTQAAIPYVNVFVKNSRVGTISDTSGYFILSATPKDTLIISCLGYKTVAVFVPAQSTEEKEPLFVFLDPRAYELKNVNIIALRRQQQFEYDFMNLNVKNMDIDNAVKNFPIKEKVLAFYERDASFTGFVVSPISALYDAFSKEAKEKRKLDKIRQQEESAKFVLSKLQYSLIENITGLKGENLNKFLSWCDFRTDFLMNISDYDLVILLSHKFNTYKLQNINKDNY